MKVSVCISSFNRRDKLERVITSILQQDIQDTIEIIVVDNHSEDGTLEMLQRMHDRIWSIHSVLFKYVYLDTPTENAMVTLNTAFKMAAGEYVVVMDDDAYFASSYGLRSLVGDLDKNPNAAIVGANVKGLDNVWQMPIRNEDGSFLLDGEFDNTGLLKYFEFHGACAIFRKDIIRKIGWYNENYIIYMNELELSCKVHVQGYDVLINTDVKVYHDGVGSDKICGKKAIHFLRNYHHIIGTYFTKKRRRAILMHSLMTGGYYTERMVLHNICGNRMSVFRLWWNIGKVCIDSLLFTFMFRRMDTEFKDPLWQDLFERSYYSGFKASILDRFTWLMMKKGEHKGIR